MHHLLSEFLRIGRFQHGDSLLACEWRGDVELL